MALDVEPVPDNLLEQGRAGMLRFGIDTMSRNAELRNQLQEGEE